MRVFTTLFFLIIFSQISAQHFEWAASATQLDLGYEFSSVDADNNIVVGGNGAKRGNSKIYDGKGNIVTPLLTQYPSIILNYSPEGDLNWSLSISSELEGIAHDENNKTVLLVRKSRKYSLLKLNKKGEITDTILIPYELKRPKSRSLEINVYRFESCPDGGYILSGFFLQKGNLFENLDVITNIEGEKFIVKINKFGIPVWADILPDGKVIPIPKVSVSPTGVIYVGGTFSPRKTKGTHQSYVISYSSSGKKNWIKFAGKKSIFNSITSNSKGVCIGIQLRDTTDEVFDTKIDTASNRFMTIINFNKKGKLNWINTTSTDEAYSLKFDRNNNLYVLLGLGYLHNKHFIVGIDTVVRYGFTNYLTCFNKKGNYKWMKKVSIPFARGDNSANLLIDNCSNIYIAGYMWFMGTLNMNLMDKAFIKGTGYGGAPLVLRFNNTIPAELAKENVCVISPGPWKIGNYPNPFQSNTTITYQLTYKDKATIKIYDLKGSLIETVFSDKEHEIGKYSVKYNAQLPSGNYIVTITGTETIASAIIIVIN